MILKVNYESIRGSKSIKKKKPNSVNDFGNFVKSLILGSVILEKVSTSTLEKLEKLWEQHDGFQVGTSMYENLVNKSIDST